ncbi:hypothetical protein C1T21_01770 [Paenibacillus sp. F4]|nr:hypothetical protein C1T21_01770 [Paenibacillus sp. F4]
MGHSLILMLLKSVRLRALIQACHLLQDKAVVRAAVKAVDRIGLLIIKAVVIRVVAHSGGLLIIKAAVIKAVDHSGLPVDLVAPIGKIGKTNTQPLL